MFGKHAFEHRNINDHLNLVSIGRKIVGKCGGLPLAAKGCGGLLRSKQSEAKCKKVLNSKMRDLSSTECEILPIFSSLVLSIHQFKLVAQCYFTNKTVGGKGTIRAMVGWRVPRKGKKQKKSNN